MHNKAYMSEFRLRKIDIKNVIEGTKTEIKEKNLYINIEEIKAAILEDKHISSVEIHIARPGERKRIIPVKDVLAPIAKLQGDGAVFPGCIGTPAGAISGSGTTAMLEGVGVVTCGKLVNFQEGLIDMAGPGAEYSVFSRLCNIVLVIEPITGIDKHEHERVVREAGVKAATMIGKASIGAPYYEEIKYPNETIPEIYKKYPTLPKVVYVRQVLAQGLLHDNYIYGLNVREASFPFWLKPTELFDGALVSGNCAAPCHKHTTYHHLKDPIVEDLLAEHGKRLAFLGIIAQPVRTSFSEKERNSYQVLKLALAVGAEGAIIAEDGGGNPESDLMLTTRLLERAGIHTVIVTDEYAGSDGASPGLADVTPEANAVVTNGNGNEIVVLPPMDEIIGHIEAVETITGGHSGSLQPDGSICIEIAGIMGSTNELGMENLSTKAV
ncbi:glycine/sarcosine/betaine reductase component B subunit [Thermovirga sp.]|uniref:glycine/sarcosine/betaine reductase component B subunit n=1 Tax=Thermovirga sp. TaxID=2699834 RepID=UPI0025E2BC2C|nr:glycine/sarcosine/betaine reductase component B subunit [Thermovirga sp.]